MCPRDPIELVIFDCDGVLVDSEPITLRTMVDLCRPLGLDMDLAQALDLFRGGHLAGVVTEVERRLGHSVPVDFVATFRARLDKALDTAVEPIPGIHEALEDLPYASCVASNGPRAKMRTTLGRTDLLDRFEGRIYSAYDIGAFKPAPDLFLHAASQCGAAPAACVVVEDSRNGVQAARAADMDVIAYVPHGDAGDLEGLGAHPLDDMRALVPLLQIL